MGAKDRIKQYIDERDDLSYANVSLAAGLSNSALQKYVTGAVKSMTLENIENIIRVMGAPPRWILLGERDETLNSWMPPLSALTKVLQVSLRASSAGSSPVVDVPKLSHCVEAGLRYLAKNPASADDEGYQLEAAAASVEAARTYTPPDEQIA